MSSIHVEVVQRGDSNIPPESLHQPILNFLNRHFSSGVCLPFKFDSPWFVDLDTFVSDNVVRITAEELSEGGSATLDIDSVCFTLHVYQLHESGSVEEALGQGGSGGLFGESGGSDSITAALHWTLPSAEFDGVWDSLYYDEPIKEQLLRYAQTALVFADRKVDPTIITMNRVILLHGPPGTGKTSLCKALAQKLSIRLSKRFRYGQLIEINSHSLFSKYFSESGKLVLQMFKKISEFVEDPDAFVCVLIDEVESLTAARRGAMQGNEPSDALRVVNALLTQIDHLKRCSNVLLMATSNLIDAIDDAFIDRADIKLHVQLPSVRATYHVLKSTVEELIRVRLLSGNLGLDPIGVSETRLQSIPQYRVPNMLLSVAKRAVDGGISCRTLRKLAFLAYSEMGQLRSILDSPKVVSVEEFLPYLSKALENSLNDIAMVSGKPTTTKAQKTDKENMDVTVDSSNRNNRQIEQF